MSIQRKDADAAAQSFVSFKDFKTPFLKGFLKEFKKAQQLPTAKLTFVNNNFTQAVLQKIYRAEELIMDATTRDRTPEKIACRFGESLGSFFGALEFGICCEKFNPQDNNAALIIDSIDKIKEYLRTLASAPSQRWGTNYNSLRARVLAICLEHPTLPKDTKIILEEIALKFKV